MTGRITKIALLHTDKQVCAVLKKQILLVRPNSVFVIANSRQDFIEKSGWLIPDILFVDLSLGEDVKTKIIQPFQHRYPHTPVVYLTNQQQAADLKTLNLLQLSDINNLQAVEDHLHLINPKDDLWVKKNSRLHEYKQQLFKAITLLDMSSDKDNGSVLEILDDVYKKLAKAL